MERRTNRKNTKIGVCNLQGRVCPRFDLTPEILIFDIGSSEDQYTERIDVRSAPPEKIITMLVQRQVSVMVSGGIQREFQRMFHRKKIRVIWGVVGAVQDVVRAYAEGILDSGVRIVSGARKRPTLVVADRKKEH
jgi:predicted Fe-Mo cluster-binding NifX family protein